MLFVLAARHELAAPYIEQYKLKKDMNARPFALFAAKPLAASAVACVCGGGAANLSAAVGFLAGKYGITRDAGHRLVIAWSAAPQASPHTVRDPLTGKEFYPEPFGANNTVLESAESAAAFEAASRFFMLRHISFSGDFTPGRPYAHIYVERAAFSYPLTQRVLAALPGAQVIPIRHHKDVFSRAGQDFNAQKDSPKLILAVRERHFLFPGADVCDNFGHAQFFYATQMMNCPYHCAYCYLRGMYPSGNMVAFVNTADYFAAAEQISTAPAYLSVSYDADLLAMEPLFGFARGWADFAREHPLLTLEIRTKSVRLPDVPPAPGVILSWTVAPSGAYEKNAPPVSRRLEAARAAVNAGWRVRLCADPVLALGSWEEDLKTLFAQINALFKEGELDGVSVGGFRMSKTYFKRIQKIEPLFQKLGLLEQDGIMRYAAEDEAKIIRCYNIPSNDPDRFSSK